MAGCENRQKSTNAGDQRWTHVDSYRIETALQGGLVLVESGRLGLGDHILQTLWVYFNQRDVIGLQTRLEKS